MKPLDPRLLRYARSTRVYLAATIALGVVLAALIVAQATLLAHGITAVFLDGADVRMLTPTLLALAAVVAGRAGVAWAQETVAVRSSAAVKSELRGRLLAHLAAVGPARGGDTGAVTALITRGLDALDAYFARYLPQLVLAALVPAVVLARLLPADLTATLTIALTLPLIPIFMALVGLHTEAANRRQFRLLSRLSHHFLDVVAGLTTLKIFGRAGAQVATIRRISTEQRRLTMRTLRVAFLSSLVLELLATLSVALVAVGIGLRLVSGHLDLTTALLVLILAPEAYLPLRQVGAHYHASAEGLAAAEEAFAILETPAPARGTAPAPTGTIVFDDVVVRYRDRDALRLSATVEPGEVVALTGPSGCGKSTALDVLLGFVAPDRGRVTVGGVDLAGVDPAAWRSTIAWVPQRPYLFAGSIRDNIALGRSPMRVPEPPTAFAQCFTGTSPDAPGRDVSAAARLAGADDFIAALPDGYDAALGDDGAGLSAGQRQRIALARAFLRDAPIVLLDEPTANLDAGTADEVMAAIRRLARGRTVVIAAHRPELIALADRVVDLVPQPVGA
ncbi:thiol reductant ABC exporter subunit CydD [Paractinoplanes hotanensis]|uniref:Thiol reductant ABC exporter subunit CydD n=1 Tax=Paractinoplanes hotanensis TaxID=2906497 RepID=A0ABT0YF41_9ACTN|nr:thiol reductant ABC exporter subunit CydD [Actinoplanes hotanensis]MCM4084656.1 thiol reductant ABC exporter subunit CydD [Actinoplanes hotanensis]